MRTLSLYTALVATILALGMAGEVRAQEQPSTGVMLLSVLRALSESCPEHAMLTELRLVGDTVHLGGYALNSGVVRQLLEGLEASPFVDSVWLVSVEKQENQGYRTRAFTLQAVLDSRSNVQPGVDPEPGMFVPVHEVPSFFMDLVKQLRIQGLEVVRFQPRPEVEQGDYVELPVAIEVHGGFDQLVDLLYRQHHASRAIGWRDVELVVEEPHGAASRLILRAELLAYRLADPAEVPSLERGSMDELHPVTGWRDPFASFVQALLQERESRPPINRYGVGQFTLVGMDCVQGLAVLLDPEGQRYEIGLGDRVGRNFGQVVELRCPSLVVSEQVRTGDSEPIERETALEWEQPVGELEPRNGAE
jgi:hypothetical protein